MGLKILLLFTQLFMFGIIRKKRRNTIELYNGGVSNNSWFIMTCVDWTGFDYKGNIIHSPAGGNYKVISLSRINVTNRQSTNKQCKNSSNVISLYLILLWTSVREYFISLLHSNNLLISSIYLCINRSTILS